MKLYLDSNIVEGTPEEILEYQQLLEDKNQSDKYKILTDKLNKAKDKHSEEEIEVSNSQYFKDFTFYYLDGATFDSRSVLKTIFGVKGLFKDSRGDRYYYESVKDFLVPVEREDVREEFEKAQIEGSLLKYYPSIDEFIKL